MHLFERFNALKLNFTHKGVDEKADIEVRMGEDGKPVIDAGSGAIGGGLPEGGNNGDVIVRKKVEGGLLGHKPNVASNTIRKVYVNLDALRNAHGEYDSDVSLYSVSVMQPPEEGDEELVWVGVDTEWADDENHASILVVGNWGAEQTDGSPIIIANISDDEIEYEDGFIMGPHKVYLLRYPEEGGYISQLLTGDEYVIQFIENYGNVVEGSGGEGTGDFSVVNKFISFDEPFTEVAPHDGAEWRPLPIVRCEFTESANGAYVTCNMTYDDIIDAYVNNKKLVVGNLVRSGSDVSKTVTVIASSFGDGDGPEFKMSPLLPTDFFKYLYYSADDGLWYIMNGLS